MRAGQLRHLVTIQQITESRNAHGEVVKTWATYAQRRASVEPLVGKEYWSSSQFNSEVSVKFRIRKISGVTTKMRVSWDSRTFNIVSVIDVKELNNEIILMCREMVD